MPGLRRDRAVFVAVLCTVITACGAGPARATAPTGGIAMPEVLPETTGGMGYGEPGRQSLVVHPIAVLGRAVVARGTIAGAARRVVILQRLDPRRGWRNVARGRIHSTGRFELGWLADRSGRVSLRAVVERRRRSAAAGPPPVARVTVYLPAMATYYGPGFFGRQTACGQVLTPDMHGVAHKRLPCGTRVAITYAGREIVVPVIDRGPFHAGYSWDLTQATADVLGFTAVGAGEIGFTRAEPPP